VDAAIQKVVDAAKRPGAKFDYDRPIEGLRALGRYEPVDVVLRFDASVARRVRPAER